MQPLVSVVIPTIPSRSKFLQRAIDSVNKQTYSNIELVVVNEGLPATVQRNIGIKRSHGDFIAFLDDDDTWLREKIQAQMKVMEEHPDCPLVICFSSDLRFKNARVNRTPELITHKMLLKSFNLSSTSSYLVRKCSLECLEGNPFDASLRSAQEYDLAIRISKYHDVRCVPEILMIQHSTEGQISEDWDRKIDGVNAIAKKYKDEYDFVDRVKTLGVVNLFRIAKIPGVGNKIYKIIIPLKGFYEK